MTSDGGPAFPGKMDVTNSVGAVVREETHPGMTLRDWFAGQALAANGDNDCAEPIAVARECYALADAMLLARGAK